MQNLEIHTDICLNKRFETLDLLCEQVFFINDLHCKYMKKSFKQIQL